MGPSHSLIAASLMKAAQQFTGNQTVMLLSWTACDAYRQTLAINHGINVRQSTSRSTCAVCLVTFDASPLLMDAHCRTVDHLDIGVLRIRDGVQFAIPYACSSPSDKRYAYADVCLATPSELLN